MLNLRGVGLGMSTFCSFLERMILFFSLPFKKLSVSFRFLSEKSFKQKNESFVFNNYRNKFFLVTFASVFVHFFKKSEQIGTFRFKNLFNSKSKLYLLRFLLGLRKKRFASFRFYE